MNRINQILLTALTVMAVLFGGSLTANAATVTEDFNSGLPEGWSLVGNIFNDSDRARSGQGVWSSGKSSTDNYLVTEPIEGTLSFYWRSFGTSGSYPNGMVYVYQYDGTALGSLIQQTASYKGSTWKQETINLGNYHGQVAIALYSACVDDVTYAPYEAAQEATLLIADYPSGSTFNFGTVVEGTTKAFTLKNEGLTELSVSSVSVTGGYTIIEGAELTTIAAQSTAQLTVATPAEDAEGVLTIVSNDANSPYTVLLKSVNKVAAPQMNLDLTVVAFGRVTADTLQEVTVSNTGDAELVVTIASDNSEFTVAPTSLTVAAGSSETFTVTFVYDEKAYGSHTATITVTPNVGEPVAIRATASIKDPEEWSENFEANVLPDGWYVIGTSAKWAFADGVASGSYEPDGWLVTPRLAVAEGESMTFQAMSRQFGTDLKVQYLPENGEWTSIISEARNRQSDFETYTVSGLEAGIYRFRFASENLDLDNFEGFKLAPSSGTKETWYVSYTFHYLDDSGAEQSNSDIEAMEIEFDGDELAFNFPNPVNGNTWMRGVKYVGEGPVAYVFANGQYIGKLGSENAYFCGSDGSSLTDMVFYYDEAKQTFTNFKHILINSSPTEVDYWGYFSDVTITKDKSVLAGIAQPVGKKTTGSNICYDLQGRRVAQPAKGLYIMGGRKVVIK